MKHWGWVLLGLTVAAGLPAQALDQPVATIKLDKKSVLVSQKTFREKLAALEQAQGAKLADKDKLQFLEGLITSELIKMDMEAQGIKATDDDVLKQFRASNPGVSDAQIRQAVEKQSGQSWDTAITGLKTQIANQKYFSQFPQFQELGKLTVSDAEIKDFYDSNTNLFSAPDYVRLSHVFFDTKVQPKGTLAEIQKKAEDTLKKLTSGQLTFEEAANTLSDDPGSAKLNGDIGFLPRTIDSPAGQRLMSMFGKDFLDQVFALKKGEVSKVLTSNSGLHIVRVTQKIDKHFLGLDEPVYPGQDTTVKAAIHQNLLQRKQANGQAKIVADIGNDLRKRATIKTFEQNL